MSSIVGKIIGGGGNSIPKTYILKTDDGREIPAVLTEEEVNLTATANDIRLGKVAVTENGVIEGTKVIPAYHTTEGYTLALAGREVSLSFPDRRYDYTKLQVIICPFNTSLDKSVGAEKVAINDGVYAVNSTDLLSKVTVDHSNKTIKLGITNDSSSIWVIRYFTYKEEA